MACLSIQISHAGISENFVRCGEVFAYTAVKDSLRCLRVWFFLEKPSKNCSHKICAPAALFPFISGTEGPSSLVELGECFDSVKENRFFLLIDESDSYTNM